MKDSNNKENTPQNLNNEMEETAIESNDTEIINIHETNDMPSDYPNSYYDPDPVSSDASELVKESYYEAIHKLGVEMLETYIDLKLTGEELWEEFISVFRPGTIKNWNIALLTRWINYLSKNDIFIEKGRRKDKAQKLIDLLFRDTHIGNADKLPDIIPTSGSDVKRSSQEAPRKEVAE